MFCFSLNPLSDRKRKAVFKINSGKIEPMKRTVIEIFLHYFYIVHLTHSNYRVINYLRTLQALL